MTIQDKPFTFEAHPKVPRDLKPGRVFVTLDEEIDNYEVEANRYRANREELEGEFTPFRLRMGTYGQRQMDQQMMRIKLPYGGINAVKGIDFSSNAIEARSSSSRPEIASEND